MARKKTAKRKKKSSAELFFRYVGKFVGFLFSVLVYLLKLPFRLIRYIGRTRKKAAKTIEKKNIQMKKEAIEAYYKGFEPVHTHSGNIEDWEKKAMKESQIGIILGARGTGKTAFGVKFLENYYAKTSKKVYAMGFNDEDMPAWIEVIEDISQIKNNSFVLIDEGGVLFSSRDAMTKPNKILSELILVARHKNLNILFISQNSANLDVNILRQADYLVLKPSSLLQLDFERKKIKEIYLEIAGDFAKYNELKGITYIYSEQYRGFITNPLPSFWNVNISKAFK
jgi:hypothetical protein